MLQVYKNVVIVGDSACGKTSMLNRFRTGQWMSSEYKPTVFGNYIADPVDVGYTTVELALWDMPGAEVHHNLR